MLHSYFQNSATGVTKERYFEICEMMGNTPVESEIPVEYDDFPDEVQQALSIYFRLRDEWEGFSGEYMGKNFTGLGDILEICGVGHEERKDILDWIFVIDKVRAKCIADSRTKDK